MMTVVSLFIIILIFMMMIIIFILTVTMMVFILMMMMTTRCRPQSSPTPSSRHSGRRCLVAKSMAWNNISRWTTHTDKTAS
jgi:heme/copper-type cytochrome/quinol oxidase subunit 2